MMAGLLLLARRRGLRFRETREWLAENPMALGTLALAIGGLLAATGIRALRKGVSQDESGSELTGGTAKIAAMMRIIGGTLAFGFGIWTLIAG